MRVPIALRNLFEGRTRFVISVGGVALAILLIIVLDGIVAGSIEEVAVYIENTSFDLIVSQQSVRNLHMTTSFFPADKLDKIRKISGVKRATPILYTTDYLVSGDNRDIAYVFGYRPGQAGGPWVMAEGTDRLKPGEIVIDEVIAAKHKLSLGDRVNVLGRDFTIAGLTKDTVTIVNSIAFVRFDDFARSRNLRGVVSYGFVDIGKATGADVTDRIEREVGDVTVQTKEGFAASERRVISDMTADIMKIMNLIGFLIGLAALGLTVYTATLAKSREYGILKALGSPNSGLFLIVFEQAIVSVVIGIVIALGLAYALAIGLTLTRTNIPMSIQFAAVARVALASAVIGILASGLPIARIARLKPAEVFRH